MELEEKKASLLELTVKVVSSHVSKNEISADQLALIMMLFFLLIPLLLLLI